MNVAELGMSQSPLQLVARLRSPFFNGYWVGKWGVNQYAILAYNGVRGHLPSQIGLGVRPSTPFPYGWTVDPDRT